MFIFFVGFMYGTTVFDKDGISAAVVMAEMASYLNRQGLTLTEQLNNLYKRFVIVSLLMFMQSYIALIALIYGLPLRKSVHQYTIAT